MSAVSSSEPPAKPPLANRQIAAQQGVIRAIYAAVFDLDLAAFDSTTSLVRQWVRSHKVVGHLLAGNNKPYFSVDRSATDGLIAASATSYDERVQTTRLVHWEGADLRRNIPGDPSRRWRTEATVERDADSAWIAVRVWFSGLATDDRPCIPPTFIRDLWTQRVLSDGVEFGRGAWPVADGEALSLLADLIEDPRRDFPVVVVAHDAPLLHADISPKLVGLAHVATVSESARRELVDRLGWDHSPRGRSVMTYYPVYSGELPTRAAAPSTIEEFVSAKRTGPLAFADWLSAGLARTVTRRMLRSDAHRSFEEVKIAAKVAATQAALQQAGATTVTQKTLSLERDLALENAEMLRAEVVRAREDIEDFKALLADSEQTEEQLQAIISQRDKELHTLRGQLVGLRYALSAKGLPAHADLSSTQIEELISRNLGQTNVYVALERAERILADHAVNIVFSEAAREGAYKSPFMRPDDVLSVLVRLGFHWDEIRIGSGATIVERSRHKLGGGCWLTMRDSEVTMTMFGSERRFRHDGREVELRKHITLGGGPQNATTTAQIYFGDRDGQLLIGHVGRHLTVASTQ